MERGALSDEDFPGFAEKVVPFLHVSTRLEGKKDEALFRERGGTGFPTVMFLDAEGRKILKHAGPRTIAGFEDSLEAATEFVALAEEAGSDPKAATAYFIKQLELEWFDFEEAQTRYEALTKVSSKQKKQIEALLVDAEVRGLVKAAGKDKAKRVEAGAHFAAMWKEKRVPSNDAQLAAFWLAMADHAEEERDKKLFKKIVKAFDDTIDSRSRDRRSLKGLEDRLDDFPRR